jgi:Fe-S oxidoreductase
MGYDYGRYFGEIRLTHDLTTRPEERRWRLTPPERDAAPRDIVLYLGCNVLRTAHMVRTVTAVFDRLGLDYVTLGGPTYCCGIVHHQQGDTEAAGGMAARTVELFQRFRPREVVMWCPSCIHFYDDVRQMRLPFRVRHTAEFLVEQLPALAFTRPVPARVALHYHCQSEPRRREGLAARRLLEAVPGLAVVDVEPTAAFGRSCTAAVQEQLGRAAWDALVLDEIDRARAGGADTLATMYHGCQRLLCGFERQRSIAIEHYLSVFARGLGIEFEDTYKKYVLWGDPERILADMSPCQQASGVDPARARELVTLTFAPAPSGAAASAPS